MTFKSKPTDPNPTVFFPAPDSFTLGGDVCPGIARLVAADKKYGWQINKGWGLSGASVAVAGDELIVPQLEIEIWDEVTDWPAFRLFRRKHLSKALVQVPNGIAPKAQGILHPELTDLGVSAVVVLKITPMINDGLGSWTCKVDFLQYRLAKQAQGIPDAAIPAASQPTPTAKDQGEREMLAKKDYIENLGDVIWEQFRPQ